MHLVDTMYYTCAKMYLSVSIKHIHREKGLKESLYKYNTVKQVGQNPLFFSPKYIELISIYCSSLSISPYSYIKFSLLNMVYSINSV